MLEQVIHFTLEIVGSNSSTENITHNLGCESHLFNIVLNLLRFFQKHICFKDERERIEGLGGCVVWIGDWRVNGNIAVSRSIGDKDHKPYVSADPDTLEFDLEGLLYVKNTKIF